MDPADPFTNGPDSLVDPDIYLGHGSSFYNLTSHLSNGSSYLSNGSSFYNSMGADEVPDSPFSTPRSSARIVS